MQGQISHEIDFFQKNHLAIGCLEIVNRLNFSILQFSKKLKILSERFSVSSF